MSFSIIDNAIQIKWYSKNTTYDSHTNFLASHQKLMKYLRRSRQDKKA